MLKGVAYSDMKDMTMLKYSPGIYTLWPRDVLAKRVKRESAFPLIGFVKHKKDIFTMFFMPIDCPLLSMYVPF